MLKRSSKLAALRSLRRVMIEMRERLAFREKHKPAPGSVELGHLLGIQDGCTEIANEIRRVKKLKTR
jgi:hypothetical protein